MISAKERLRKYWLTELGCTDWVSDADRVAVCSHGTLEGYSGIIVYRENESCIASVPRAIGEQMRRVLGGQNLKDIFQIQILKQILGKNVDRIIGPAWVACIEKSDFIPFHGDETRLISESDWPKLEKFLASCSKNEVELSSLVSGRDPTFGVFVDGEIVAASSYELVSDDIAHIGILTHPNFRAKGFAKKAISKAVSFALAENLTVQYRTLLENIPSVSAAKHLGFSELAQTIAIRLKRVQ